MQEQTVSGAAYSSYIKGIISEVKKAVIGKDEIIVKVLLAILARGHILIEDIPGVGKTTLALAFSKALSLEYNRMQFTSDVLPTDVTGFSVYNKQTDSFIYKPGVAMCNLFLADEINRTSSKTQSALLEVMEEGKVTVDGVTREVPKPYIVIATQNPIGSIGTQMLPESQLDRFMIRLSMGYPDIESEISILKAKRQANPLQTVRKVIGADEIMRMQAITDSIYVSDKIYQYIAALAAETRAHPLIILGISPRGTLALAQMAKAAALVSGRGYVIPDDVKYVFPDVAVHRLVLNPKAKINDVSALSLVEEVLAKVPVPRPEKHND